MPCAPFSFLKQDLDSARRTSGNGFYYLTGDIARLHSAVLTYARDFMIDKGFTYCIPPFMIRSDVIGTSSAIIFGIAIIAVLSLRSTSALSASIASMRSLFSFERRLASSASVFLPSRINVPILFASVLRCARRLSPSD